MLAVEMRHGHASTQRIAVRAVHNRISTRVPNYGSRHVSAPVPTVAARSSYQTAEARWNPPSEPDERRPPPEYTPPSTPDQPFRPPPEYTPPEQNPGEETRRGDPPLRPIRPDEEPNIPDPESPNADPVRTPERRREITEPAPREEPSTQPERE